MTGTERKQRLLYEGDDVWVIRTSEPEEAGVPGLVYERDGRWSVVPPVQEGNVWQRFRAFMESMTGSERRQLYSILTAWRADDTDPSAKQSTTAHFRGALGGPFARPDIVDDASSGHITEEAISRMSSHAREHLRNALIAAVELGYVRKVGSDYLPVGN